MLYRIDEILGYLNRCDRVTSSQADPLEILAKRLSLRGLIVSFIFFAINVTSAWSLRIFS